VRRTLTLALAFTLAIPAAFAQDEATDRDVLFQTSTVGALLQGVYDGPVPLGELGRHGDLGLGTVNSLDGELVVVDGRFYTVDAAGDVHEPAGDVCTPFAAVTWFEPDDSRTVAGVPGYEALQQLIDELLPTPNLCYAIRITGLFSYVRTRSVPKQERPYRPLAEVVRTQPVFELSNVEGTLVGFRLPAFVAGVNVPGYHLHFLAADRSGGGHLLDCRVDRAEVEIDHTATITVALPGTSDFFECTMPGGQEEALHEVER